MTRTARFTQIVLWMLLLLLPATAVAEQAAPASLPGKIVLPTGDMAVRTPPKPMELLSSADVSQLNEYMAGYDGREEELLVNRAESYYYYSCLDPVSREIYDVIYDVARDPVSEGNIGLIMTPIDPQSDEFYDAFGIAIRAVCFDHPELFWLYSAQETDIGFASEAVIQNGFYLVYFLMMEPFENFETEMRAFNQAADAFLADIDTSASEFEIVRQIHDKLIGMVDYNNPVADGRVISFDGQDLAHTAYGALVQDTSGNPHYAVCDGYTLAFEYLLQQCGIESIFIGGEGGSDLEHMGGHAWNMVKVDGVWYEVDSTWNDWGNVENDLAAYMTQDNFLSEALHDPVYRDRLDHFLFLISTEEMSHFVPDERYIYTSAKFGISDSLVEESVHVRLTTGEDSSMPDPKVISLAPVAMQAYPGR